MTPDEQLALLRRTADAIVDALAGAADWGPSGLKAGQYSSDLTADAAALSVLSGADVSILSEESGNSARSPSGVMVVVDPLDGSTNASRRLSWWAVSLCSVDASGAAAAVVHDLRHGTRYEAIRGGGATRDGITIAPSAVTRFADAMVGLSGLPPRYLGWKQFRALGAAALDLCAVADGTLDAYVDCSRSAHGPWDYLGGMLVCQEAGAVVADAAGRELVVTDHADRRTPIAAATPELLAEVNAARQTFDL